MQNIDSGWFTSGTMVGPVIGESLWNQYWLEVWRLEAEAVIIPGVNMP